ncbi:hypothetical protein T440DRAFT_559615 [Plenodomus tracheiphilus IPT5]|uniref:Uncharacterized protein n=1 Tax=Plenodomus tracheiphilus IPT5 TaxID=1408161 RepID=A0A6A7AMZ7_9PLEO|nr:hypothetical protein T440DRAFT_559615 [Plenodomus tracheiphilus IPT5]
MPSLLDDPLTKYLWQQVQNMGSYENAAQSFWHHVYTKALFNHRTYAVDYEDPPITEEQGQRKVDQTVRVLSSDWGTLYVLLFHEIKRNEISNAELETVEFQAYTASQSYCKKHNISRVYSQTSVGSRARFFLFSPGSWTPLDGKDLGVWDAYQEFGDRDGEKYIIGQLEKIKREGPTLPTITWVWDPNHNKHFYVTPVFFIFDDGTKIKK